MPRKKTPEIGDLVMLNNNFKDRGRLAIITELFSWTTTEVFITFTDTCEKTHTYVSSLEWLDESR